MKTITNTSKSRTIIHDDGGNEYRIPPLSLKEVPDNVAENILSGWPFAECKEEDQPNLPKTPWEWRCGPTWEKAKKENNLSETPDKTSGPDRPPVVEPSKPADAFDPETGAVIQSKLNKHVCNICAQSFPTLKGCRGHQKREHQS